MSSSRHNRVPTEELFQKDSHGTPDRAQAHDQPRRSHTNVQSDLPRRPTQATSNADTFARQSFIGGRNTAACATKVKSGSNVQSNKNDQTNISKGKDRERPSNLPVDDSRKRGRADRASDPSLPASTAPTTLLSASSSRKRRNTSDEELGAADKAVGPNFVSTPAAKKRKKNREGNTIPEGVPSLQYPFRYVWRGKTDDLDNLYVLQDDAPGKEWKYTEERDIIMTVHLEQSHETFKADDKLLDGAPELIHPHYYFFVSARGETPRHVRFLTDALPGTSIPLVGNEAYIEKCVLQIKESARVLTPEETPQDLLPLPSPYQYIANFLEGGATVESSMLLVWNSQAPRSEAFPYLGTEDYVEMLRTEALKMEQKSASPTRIPKSSPRSPSPTQASWGVPQSTLDVDTPMPSAYEEESGDDQKPGDIPLTQPERAPSEFSGRSDSERDELEEDENEDSEVTKELLRPSSDQNIAPSIRIPETQWQEMEIDTRTASGNDQIVSPSIEIPVTHRQGTNTDIVSPAIEIPVTHWPQGIDTDATDNDQIAVSATEIPVIQIRETHAHDVSPKSPTPMLQDGHIYSEETERSDGKGKAVLLGRYVETSMARPEHDPNNSTEHSGLQTYHDDANDEDEGGQDDGHHDNDNDDDVEATYERPYAYQQESDDGDAGPSYRRDRRSYEPRIPLLGPATPTRDSLFREDPGALHVKNCPPPSGTLLLSKSPQSRKGKEKAVLSTPTRSRVQVASSPPSSSEYNDDAPTDKHSDESDDDSSDTTHPTRHVQTIPPQNTPPHSPARGRLRRGNHFTSRGTLCGTPGHRRASPEENFRSELQPVAYGSGRKSPQSPVQNNRFDAERGSVLQASVNRSSSSSAPRSRHPNFGGGGSSTPTPSNISSQRSTAGPSGHSASVSQPSSSHWVVPPPTRRNDAQGSSSSATRSIRPSFGGGGSATPPPSNISSQRSTAGPSGPPISRNKGSSFHSGAPDYGPSSFGGGITGAAPGSDNSSQRSTAGGFTAAPHPDNSSQQPRAGPSGHTTSGNQPPSFHRSARTPQAGIGRSSHSSTPKPGFFDFSRGFAAPPPSTNSPQQPFAPRSAPPPRQSNTLNLHPPPAEVPPRRRPSYQTPYGPAPSDRTGGSASQPPGFIHPSMHAFHDTNLHAMANIFVSELARQFGPIVASAIQTSIRRPTAAPLVVAPSNPSNKTHQKRHGRDRQGTHDRDRALKNTVREYRALLIPPDRELDLNPGHEEAAEYAAAYEENPKTDFDCSLNCFRVYLGANPGHRWNLSAQKVFVRGLIAQQNLPDTSEMRNMLRRLFIGQIKYLMKQYRESLQN